MLNISRMGRQFVPTLTDSSSLCPTDSTRVLFTHISSFTTSRGYVGKELFLKKNTIFTPLFVIQVCPSRLYSSSFTVHKHHYHKTSTLKTTSKRKIEFFTIRVSVRLSDRFNVTQNKINFVKNCPQWGWKPGSPNLQASALPTELSQHSVASLNLHCLYKVMLY